MFNAREQAKCLSSPMRVVVKIGSSSVVDAGTKQVALSTITMLVETVCSLIDAGHQVVLVSSGAVGIGTLKMALEPGNRCEVTRRALASVGQGRLMRVYDDLFSYYNKSIAQLLFTRSDLQASDRYKRLQRTVNKMLELGVIPIINENDPISDPDTQFQDNDQISALLSAVVDADWLFLLTDVDALYTANPNSNPNAKPIHVVEDIALLDSAISISGTISSWGTGGMQTKVNAARLATSAGCKTVITSSYCPHDIIRILNGAEKGTVFLPSSKPVSDHERWILNCLAPKGILQINGTFEGGNLNLSHLESVTGCFKEGCSVRIVNSNGKEIARGLSILSSAELQSKLSNEMLTKGEKMEIRVIEDENLASF
eukprot:Nk52_evm59s230 gene=Nk52_evmTU59s230